jgi:hypothetical protein
VARKGRSRRNSGFNFAKSGEAAVRKMAKDRDRRHRESQRADDQRRGGDDTWFEKYRSSVTEDTGQPQTDLQFGEKGTKGGYVAVDGNGDLLFMRDADGRVVYDPANGLDRLPPGWEG